MSKGIAGLLLLGLCCGHLSAAEVLRWQDSQGQWHFGGPEAAAENAEPVVMAPPSRGLDMKLDMKLDDAVVTSPARRGKRKAVERRLEEPAAEDRKTSRKRQPQTQKEFCEQWRERLRKSRLGLRDHEAQDAYGRECILSVHW